IVAGITLIIPLVLHYSLHAYNN
ncbi:hypothetical protein LCGC14_1827680, partial [marine sediment metagenome]